MSVTEAEAKVLKVLWDQSPATAAEVADALAADGQDWHRKTVNTLLSRLEEKGALAVTNRGRPKRYAPAMAKEAFLKDKLKELAQGLFGGQLAPVVATLVEAEMIDEDDLAQLRGLIERLEQRHD